MSRKYEKLKTLLQELFQLNQPDLRARLANDAVDIGRLEREAYAIPYEGEEVTLHWASRDQYYIKTSEYLRDCDS